MVVSLPYVFRDSDGDFSWRWLAVVLQRIFPQLGVFSLGHDSDGGGDVDVEYR
jgi:hypothetical protein